MAISNVDRCPTCGSMYTGSLLPGEDPDNRYCYTCEMQAGSQAMADRLEVEAANEDGSDELSLQMEPGASAGQRRPGRMAPGGRPVNRRPVSARQAPQGRPSRAAMAAVEQPQIEQGEDIEVEVESEMEPEPAPAPRRQGSSVNIPPARRTGSSVIMPAVQRGSNVNMPAVPSNSRPNMPAVQRGSNISMPGVPANSRANMPAVSRGSNVNMPAVQPGSRTNIPAVQRGSNVNMPAVQPGSRTNIPAVQRGSNVNMPAVQPGSRTNIPAVQRGSNVNMPAVQTGSRGHMTAVSRGSAAGIPAARRGSSVTMPAVQGSARSSARNKVPADKTKMYVLCAGGLIGLVVLVLLFKSGKPKPTEEVALAAPKTEAAPTQKLLTVEEALRAAEAAAKKDPPKVEAPKVEAPPVETAKAEPAKTEEKAAATAALVKEEPQVAVAEKKAEEEKPATDVNDLLQVSGPRKAANAKLSDEEAEAGPAVKPVSRAAAPAGGNEPQRANADADKKPDAMVGLGLKKQAEPEKPLPPGAKPPPVAPTAKEPTVVALDLGKGDQTRETQFSRSLTNMPGWRVRDINIDNSLANQSEHRGRKNVLALNPMNDVVPAKLVATIEIPANFAGKRPVLLYELSGKDATHDWFLTVKCMNVELVSKQAIKTKDFAWIDSGVDLSPLAGKRFEIQIEATIPKQKDTKKLKEYVAYFRNVRLDWSGKPK